MRPLFRHAGHVAVIRMLGKAVKENEEEEENKKKKSERARVKWPLVSKIGILEQCSNFKKSLSMSEFKLAKPRL